MLVKKNIALKKIGGKGLISAGLEFSVSGLTLTARTDDCLAGILCDGGAEFSPLSSGAANFKLRPENTFCIGLFEGGTLDYFFNGGVAGGQEKIVKALYASGYTYNQNVKNMYDDEAIAVDNYYTAQPLINPTFTEKMREKGHLLKSEHIFANQNSTVYPQCVDCENEENNNEKYKNNDEDDRAAAPQNNGTKAPPCADKLCQDDGCGSRHTSGGGEPVYYSKIKEELESLFYRYERVPELEQAVDGSVFVRIPYDGQRFYVAGKTTVNGRAECVVFGVPANGGEMPPEFKGKAFKVPCGASAYFLIYQYADSGEIVFP